MPGSSNPWASELKARKTSIRQSKSGNNPETETEIPDRNISLGSKVSETPQNETRGAKVSGDKSSNKNQTKLIEESTEKKSNKNVTTMDDHHKDVKKKVLEEKTNDPKVKMEDGKKEMKRKEEPIKKMPKAAPPPPVLKSKIKTLPLEVEEGNSSLYQDARSHLKRVVTRQISRGAQKEKETEEDEDDLTPIDRLIRQGSFEPNKNFEAENLTRGRSHLHSHNNIRYFSFQKNYIKNVLKFRY